MWPLYLVSLSTLLTPAAHAAATLRLRGGGAAVAAEAEGHVFAYDYAAHGQDWVIGSCSSRTRQSPIDFSSADIAVAAGLAAAPLIVVGAETKLPYRYSAITTAFQLRNNGRTYAADLGALGYGGVAYDDAWYDLMSVNVHASSEHTFAGEHRPAELHLVHKRYDGDALLIVAVPLDNPSASSRDGPGRPPSRALAQPALLQRGGRAVTSSAAPLYVAPSQGEENFSPTLQAFLNVALPLPYESASALVGEANPLDLNALLQNGTFLEYFGSMSAPPCAETVTWLVRSEPVAASGTQLRYLVDGVLAMTAGEGNYREVMPLNGRTVGAKRAVYEEPPLPDVVYEGAASGVPASAGYTGALAAAHAAGGPDATALRTAHDALHLAMNASEYIRELEARLRGATAAVPAAPCPRASPAAGVNELAQAAAEAAARAEVRLEVAANSSAQEAARQAVQAVLSSLIPQPSPAPALAASTPETASAPTLPTFLGFPA